MARAHVSGKSRPVSVVFPCQTLIVKPEAVPCALKMLAHRVSLGEGGLYRG